jgi:translocator assembly and maintenance protein 41
MTTMTTTTNDDDAVEKIRDDNDGQLASKRMIRDEILSKFPQNNLVYSFGYGSGVFTQTLKNTTTTTATMASNNDNSKDNKNKDNSGSGGGGGGGNACGGMLDLILVVDDTYKFHKENLKIFPNHYAPWLRYGGPNLVTNIQRKGLLFPFASHLLFPDANVLFHVVDNNDDDNNNSNNNHLPKMKYGVVDKKDLIQDLTEWNSLYLAGRLHKPTLPIITPDDDDDDDDDDELMVAQMKNLKSATAAALLLSSSSSNSSPSSSSSNNTSLSWSSFYKQISSLSYTGDFRMKVGGEDPYKIDKLVQGPGQIQRFNSLYQPILQDSFQKMGLISINKDGGLEWDSNDPSTISYLQQQLPQSLRQRMNNHNKNNNLSSQKVDRDVQVQVLATTLAGIVAPAARNQSFKGIFTLGLRKSIQYAKAKLSKGRFGRGGG